MYFFIFTSYDNINWLFLQENTDTDVSTTQAVSHVT